LLKCHHRFHAVLSAIPWSPPVVGRPVGPFEAGPPAPGAPGPGVLGPLGPTPGLPGPGPAGPGLPGRPPASPGPPHGGGGGGGGVTPCHGVPAGASAARSDRANVGRRIITSAPRIGPRVEAGRPGWQRSFRDDGGHGACAPSPTGSETVAQCSGMVARGSERAPFHPPCPCDRHDSTGGSGADLFRTPRDDRSPSGAAGACAGPAGRWSGAGCRPGRTRSSRGSSRRCGSRRAGS
jgi:hypothetical protein